jgi:hypothetical protein
MPTMKNILPFASLVFAVASAAFAQNATGHDDCTAIFSAEADIAVAKGMSREAFPIQLSAPKEKPGNSVWVYWDCKGKGAPEATKYDVPVVSFADSTVSELYVDSLRERGRGAAPQKPPPPVFKMPRILSVDLRLHSRRSTLSMPA